MPKHMTDDEMKKGIPKDIIVEDIKKNKPDKELEKIIKKQQDKENKGDEELTFECKKLVLSITNKNYTYHSEKISPDDLTKECRERLNKTGKTII